MKSGNQEKKIDHYRNRIRDKSKFLSKGTVPSRSRKMRKTMTGKCESQGE